MRVLHGSTAGSMGLHAWGARHRMMLTPSSAPRCDICRGLASAGSYAQHVTNLLLVFHFGQQPRQRKIRSLTQTCLLVTQVRRYGEAVRLIDQGDTSSIGEFSVPMHPLKHTRLKAPNPRMDVCWDCQAMPTHQDQSILLCLQPSVSLCRHAACEKPRQCAFQNLTRPRVHALD